MRPGVLGLAAALSGSAVLGAGAAAAADYIAVNPPKFRGQEFDIGQKVQVGPRQPLALMHMTGDVTQRWGDAAGWITVPPHPPAPRESDWALVIRVLVTNPAPSGRTFGGIRGVVCPKEADLRTFDDIMAAGRTSGCRAVARAALDAHIARELAEQPPAPDAEAPGP